MWSTDVAYGASEESGQTPVLSPPSTKSHQIISTQSKQPRRPVQFAPGVRTRAFSQPDHGLIGCYERTYGNAHRTLSIRLLKVSYAARSLSEMRASVWF
eukprot:2361270-Rhodomonas_salina.3